MSFLAVPDGALALFDDERQCAHQCFVFLVFRAMDNPSGSASIVAASLAAKVGLSRHQGDRVLRQLVEGGWLELHRERRGVRLVRTWRPARVTRESDASQTRVSREATPAPAADCETETRVTRESDASQTRVTRDFLVDQTSDSSDFTLQWKELCARVGWTEEMARDHLRLARRDTYTWAQAQVDPARVAEHLAWWASNDKKPLWLRSEGHGLRAVLRYMNANEDLVRRWRNKRVASGALSPAPPDEPEAAVSEQELMDMVDGYYELDPEDAARMAKDLKLFNWVPPGGRPRISGKPSTEKTTQ